MQKSPLPHYIEIDIYVYWNAVNKIHRLRLRCSTQPLREEIRCVYAKLHPITKESSVQLLQCKLLKPPPMQSSPLPIILPPLF